VAEAVVEPGGQGAEEVTEARSFVFVPEHPGPLIREQAPSTRARDDLDELIDDLFPDTDERPGWFDAALIAIGAALIGWGAIASGPTASLIFGAIALTLGCILPARSILRRAQRARRRSAVQGRGVPLSISDPVIERLVRAYDAIVASASAPGLGVGPQAIAAAHGAVLEVATLLRGKAPASDGERQYAEKRASAIADLTKVLQKRREGLLRVDDDSRGDDTDALDHAALLQAREELDAIAGFTSLTRLEGLTAEVRTDLGNG
jgi:hypothetical protein